MSGELSLPLLAEAIALDAVGIFDSIISSRKIDEFPLLLKLDLILSTVTHFADCYRNHFEEIIAEHCPRVLSKEEFTKFLVVGCEHLCSENDWFNLFLAFGFASEVLNHFKASFECFHFVTLTSRYLERIMKEIFRGRDCMDYLWDSLLSYCEKVKRESINNRNVESTTNTHGNTKLNDLGLTVDETRSTQLKNVDTADSKMPIVEDCRLQAHSKYVIGIPGSLAEEEKCKQQVAEAHNHRDPSNLAFLKVNESKDEVPSDKSNVTESPCEYFGKFPEDFHEVMRRFIMRQCNFHRYTRLGDYLPDSNIEEQGISLMLPPEICSPEHNFVWKGATSDANQSIEKKMKNEKVGESSNSSSMNTLEAELSRTSSGLSDKISSLSNSPSSIASNAEPSRSLSSTAINDDCCSSDMSKDENNLVKCCELCKGKEKYLEIRRTEFLRRYPVFK